jgi:hypothetical protein
MLTRKSQTIVAACTVVLALGFPTGARPQDDSLPDVATFIDRVRANLKADDALLPYYTYRERRRAIKVNRLGKLTVGSLREFEVYPSPIRGQTYKRLIAVDGKPLDEEELARNDAIRREDLRKKERRAASESASARTRRLAAEARERAEQEALVDDAFRVFHVKLTGRERVDGHETLVAEITPRPEAKVTTRYGKMMKKVKGRAWVSPADHQLVKAEVEVIDDITYAWGLVGRVYQGSRFYYRRAMVNNEIWLPAEMRIVGSGRTLMFRPFRIDTITEYFGYRKSGVDATQRLTPAPPGN